jgi:hypothetical protein
MSDGDFSSEGNDYTIELLAAILFIAILAAIFWPSGLTISSDGLLIFVGVVWVALSRIFANRWRSHHLWLSRWFPIRVHSVWFYQLIVIVSGIVFIAIGGLMTAGVLVVNPR